MSEVFALNRYLEAQENVYARVLSELRAGKKTTHWIWFIFPQIAGLGYSLTAKKYAIQSIEEAYAYLKHDLLGKRLRECTELVLAIEGNDIDQVFGYPDNLKFRSCMTLFNEVADDNNCFKKAIEQFFSGEPDEKTLEILKKTG